MYLCTRLQWVMEFITFAVMWSWWNLCPALSGLRLVLSSASTLKRMLFICMLLASELPTFYEPISLWTWIFVVSFQWKVFLFIVWHCRTFFSRQTIFVLSFFAVSEKNFHISGHTVSGLEVVCFLVRLFRTVKIRQVVFRSIKWIL